MAGIPGKMRSQVTLFIITRIVINTAYRATYPFLRVIAAGLGVTLPVISLALTIRSLAGGLGPFLAPVADRFGRKTGMLLGLSIFSLGTGFVAIWPTLPAFFAAIILAHVGNMIFLPAMQAYLGDQIAYQRRGTVLALTELSWSLSFIIMVPLAGLLIARLGWWGPFPFLAGLGLLMTALVAWRIPGDVILEHRRRGSLWSSLGQVVRHPAAWLALSFYLLINCANELVNLVFGVWLNDSFGLQIAALGLAAVVIGAAELGGEAATATLTDRVGKKRAVRAGLLITSLAAISLPLIGTSLPGALVGLFLFYLGFEFTLVSYIPLLTEVLPDARATIMAAGLAVSSLGRALGALVGPWLYAGGFEQNALISLLLNGLALLVLARLRIGDE